MLLPISLPGFGAVRSMSLFQCVGKRNTESRSTIGSLLILTSSDRS